MFVITHSVVAAGSRQRRADNACALDQSHSAASGDALSASSSHPLFDNRSAAEMRNTPREARGRTQHSKAEGTVFCMEDDCCYIQIKKLKNTIPPN